MGVVFVLEVLPAVGCVVAGALPFGCVVVEAGFVVALPGFAVMVVVDVPDDGVLDVPLGCEGAVVEDGVGVGVIGATGSPGFGSGLDVMPAINSLSPVSEPLLRYL